MKPEGPTLDELKTWPALIDITQCAVALGCGKSAMYEWVKRGNLPFRTVSVGCRTRVVTASLIHLLETGESDVKEST